MVYFRVYNGVHPGIPQGVYLRVCIQGVQRWVYLGGVYRVYNGGYTRVVYIPVCATVGIPGRVYVPGCTTVGIPGW